MAQAENNERRRLDWRQAYVDEELGAVQNVRRIQLFVTLDEERLRRSVPEEHTLAPEPGQERADVAAGLGPQLGIVRLEDHPLGAHLDRLLDDVEQAAHVDVAPGSIAAQCPGAPHAPAAAPETATAVHPAPVVRV